MTALLDAINPGLALASAATALVAWIVSLSRRLDAMQTRAACEERHIKEGERREALREMFLASFNDFRRELSSELNVRADRSTVERHGEQLAAHGNALAVLQTQLTDVRATLADLRGPISEIPAIAALLRSHVERDLNDRSV